MNTSNDTVATTTGFARIRDAATDALRYWEPRRLLYNAVLAAIVLWYFAREWPDSRSTVTFNGVLILFLLAVLANVSYCAAYVGDVFVQLSGMQEQWRKWRWVVLLIGTVFAAIITRFFALGFFSAPHGAEPGIGGA